MYRVEGVDCSGAGAYVQDAPSLLGIATGVVADLVAITPRFTASTSFDGVPT